MFQASPFRFTQQKSQTKQKLKDGQHPAILYGLVNLGWQEHKVYGPSMKVLLMFDAGGVPISRQFTMSMHEKSALRAVIQSWENRIIEDEEAYDIDLAAYVGRSCILQIKNSASNGKEYANIAGIFPYNGPPLKTDNNLIFYAAGGDEDIKSELPEWVQRICDSAISEEEAMRQRKEFKKQADLPF